MKKRLLTILTILVLSGCDKGGGAARDGAPVPANGDSRPTASGSAAANPKSPGAAQGTEGAQTPVAIVNQTKVITWADLREISIEASGSQVFSEYLLDMLIEEALAKKGMKLTEQDVEKEKATYLALLRRESNAKNDDEAIRTLDRIRKQNGWGPRRFQLLMRRNAGLRKLIEGQGEVTEIMIKDAFEQRYGEKILVRMIMVSDLTAMDAVLKKIAKGDKESFIDAAIIDSRDDSRFTGGLLPLLSPADPSFPAVVRATAAKLKEGQVSDVIAMDNGMAVLRCEKRLPKVDKKLEEVRQELIADLQLQNERYLMNRQARTLLDDNNLKLSILNKELADQWTRQKAKMTGVERK